jgi:quercetin dioxygenase-like cupin family protein
MWPPSLGATETFHKFRLQQTYGGNMTEKISNMAALVAYQDGSIVSKEIIKKPTGTTTIFAFDRDQGLSEHTAPFDALVYILDGEAEIIISGEPHQLKTGEMIIMPGGKSHALKALKRFKMMLVMIRS